MRVTRAGAIVAVSGALVGCTHVEQVHHHHVVRVELQAATSPEPAPLADPLDAVVRVASLRGECSGAVVSDRIVITSRTCLGRITSPASFPTDRVRARIGGGAVPWLATPAVAILAAPCHGVAAIVTREPLAAVTPLRLRLGAEVAIGEPVRIAGFGRCSPFATGARSVGPAGWVRMIGDAAFTIDAIACAGDAGAPILSDWTGEIVGVLGGDAARTDTAEPGSSPAGEVARIDLARGLLAQAFLVSHGVPAHALPAIACE